MNTPPERSILIVDDDELNIVKPLCKWFGLESWQAVGALNGFECMERMRRQKFDVVLLDAQMPGDGLVVLGRIVAEYPMVCVIMYTAYEEQYFRAAFRAGAWDVLSKVMSPPELSSHVEVQLARFLESRCKDHTIAQLQTFFDFCRALTHGQKNRMDPIRVWTRKMADEPGSEARQSILRDKLEPLFDDTRQSLERFEHYAQFEEATPSLVGLLDLCRVAADTAVKRFTRHRYGPRPSITCEGDDSIRVWVDSVLFIEILENLFSNALESSPPGKPIVARIWNDEYQAILRVEDSGSGFHSEVLQHLGEHVVSTKKAQGGFGVGLLMAARIARQLGGGFAAGNHPDRPGAWVEISIPLATITNT